MSESRFDPEIHTPPYWEITIYSDEEIKRFLDADELTPELEQRYADLLDEPIIGALNGTVFRKVRKPRSYPVLGGYC